MSIVMRDINKSYGAVEALKGVDFHARRGEVMAILGDNGAGKSTLIKILSGALEPTSGTMSVDDKEVKFSKPNDARDAGIGTLYQDLALFDGLSVSMNFYIGREATKFLGFLDYAPMQRHAGELINKYSVRDMNIHNAVGGLSGGQRQIVALARTVGFGGNYVILDEPTSALSPSAAQEVLDVVRQMRDQGIGVILITHNILQAMSVADEVTVLRLGEVAGVRKVSETTEEDIVSLIVGVNQKAA